MMMYGRGAPGYNNNSNNNSNNSSYGYSSNNSYGYNSNSSNRNEEKLGSYRGEYRYDEPSSYLTAIITNWKANPPLSITTREEFLHLSVTELRIEDYYLMRNKKLRNSHDEKMREAIRKESYNDLLNQTNCYNLMPYSRDNPMSLDAVRSICSQNNSYGNNSSNTYGNNNSNTYGNNSSSNSGIYNTRNSNIFNGNNGYNSSNNNNSSYGNNNNNSSYGNNNSSSYGNNNSSNSSNIFNRNNNSSSNSYNNNSNNNNSSNIFSSNNNASNNIFNRNSNTGNNNSYNNSYNSNNNSSSNNGGANIFNRGNNNSSSNIFSNTNNNNNGGNIFNNGNNNNNNSNSNNIFNNGSNNNGNNIFSNNNNNGRSNIFNNNNNSGGNNIFNNGNNNNGGNNIFGNNNGSRNLFNNGNNNGMFNNGMYNNQDMSMNPMGFDPRFLTELHGYMKSMNEIIKKINGFSQEDERSNSNCNSHNSNSLFPTYDSSYLDIYENQLRTKRKRQEDNMDIVILVPEAPKPEHEGEEEYNSSIKQTRSINYSQVGQDPKRSNINKSQLISNTRGPVLNNTFKTKSVIKEEKAEEISEEEECECTVKLSIQWLDSKSFKGHRLPSEINATVQVFGFKPENKAWKQQLLFQLKNPLIRSDASIEISSSQVIRKGQKVYAEVAGVLTQRILNNIFDTCEFKRFQNGLLHGLTLSNKHGKVIWKDPIKVQRLDFCHFAINENEIEADPESPLNCSCLVEFYQVPGEILKLLDLNKKAAQEKMANAVNQQGQGKFRLISLEKNMWTMEVLEFP